MKNLAMAGKILKLVQAFREWVYQDEISRANYQLCFYTDLCPVIRDGQGHTMPPWRAPQYEMAEGQLLREMDKTIEIFQGWVGGVYPSHHEESKAIDAENLRRLLEGEGANGVYRWLGPTDAENQSAKMRLAQIDSLDKLCEWDSACPSIKALSAREHRQKIMGAQTKFEEKYC